MVLLYMGNEFNNLLRPILEKQLKPGTRIVSHRFVLGDWAPDKTIKVTGPGRRRVHPAPLDREGEEEVSVSVADAASESHTGRSPCGFLHCRLITVRDVWKGYLCLSRYQYSCLRPPFHGDQPMIRSCWRPRWWRLWAGWSLAADLKSGPQAGEKVPGPFHPLQRQRRGRRQDRVPVLQGRRQPGRRPSSPAPATTPMTQKLIKALDAETVKNAKAEMCSFAVFCGDNEQARTASSRTPPRRPN